MNRDVIAAQRDPSRSALSTRSARVDFLDTLRFVAAAAVLFQHLAETQGEIGVRIASLLSPGVFGVALFFIVSGFVIPMSAKGSFVVSDFVIRRIFRIYPLVLATFAVLALMAYCTDLQAFREARDARAVDWVANLLLIQDYTRSPALWGVTWTLSLELIWYGLFAASLLVLGRRFDHYLALGLPLFMLAVAALSLATEVRAPVGRIGMIYAAVLGCRMYRCWSGEIDTRRAWLDAAVFVATMSAGIAVSFGYFTHPKITLMQALVPWIVAPALFVAIVAIPRLREQRLLRNPVLCWLGSISFSIYLLHPLAITLAQAFYPAHVWELAPVLTLLFAIAGYRLVEVPGQVLGRRLIAWNRSRRASLACRMNPIAEPPRSA